MLWPDVGSTSSAEAITEFRRNKGYVLDRQIDVEIGPKSVQSLTYSVSRLFAEMHHAKTKAPWITYNEIPPVANFSQGIREENTLNIRGILPMQIVKDYYIEWVVDEEPSKFMVCRTYDARLTC